MSYPCWVDPSQEETLHQIVFDTETLQLVTLPEISIDQVAAAEDAISAATEILHRLTGRQIHGPGVAVDEYLISAGVRRLSTTFKPIRAVVSAERISGDGGATVLDTSWSVIGGSVFFGRRVPYGSLAGSCQYGADSLRLTYRYGSTVTRGARSTLLYYARQLYLASPYGDINTCELPERVTSVNREGLSMTTLDPQTFLDKGLTGLIRVDEWLAGYAARKSYRPSALYAADSPPPVNIATWCNDVVPDAGPLTLKALK